MLWIPTDEFIFPHPFTTDKNGVLALGGDLSPQRLITAYLFGIFPWYNEGEPIIWWSIKPRMILYPEKIKVSKSMRSFLKKEKFKVTQNLAFSSVMKSCADVKRFGQDGTWIHEAMLDAYQQLHQMGYAISLEVWDGENLVGGLYGLKLGKIFFGESMFSLKSNASKVALIALSTQLIEEGFILIDCQQDTPHIRTMGGQLIDQQKFMNHLRLNQKYFLRS